jgi:hypothetical protein
MTLRTTTPSRRVEYDVHQTRHGITATIANECSLPAADYEFKYLLKRIELARPKPPDIIVVTGRDGATITRKNYRRFFGNRLNKCVFNDGLTDDAIDHITRRSYA